VCGEWFGCSAALPACRATPPSEWLQVVGAPVPIACESDLFEFLGLNYVPIPMRQALGR